MTNFVRATLCSTVLTFLASAPPLRALVTAVSSP